MFTNPLRYGTDKAYRKVVDQAAGFFTGRNVYENTVASNREQIAYNEYMRGGNLRAYNDWQKNVGVHGRTIRYPELSYPGAIRGYDTGTARAYYSNDSAYSNYIGNYAYRAAGLYGISGRVSRSL